MTNAAPPPTSSAFTLDDLAKLQEVMLFGEDDVAALRQSREVLAPHIEEILDTWYGFVGSKPQLLESFSNPRTGAPDTRYLAEVRKRFGQWIDDTARAEYDESWLAYQYEIGLRHHRAKKNRTDGVESTDIILFRYLVALHQPVTITIRPFLERGGHSKEEVDRMHQAWIKSVLLQVILWSQPYVKEGQF